MADQMWHVEITYTAFPVGSGYASESHVVVSDGDETEATTRSHNPEYSGYDMCAECAREYDAREESIMATLRDIRENPEYLGNPVTDEDVELFCAAVEALMSVGMEEAEAIKTLWGNGDGDWMPMALALLEK